MEWKFYMDDNTVGMREIAEAGEVDDAESILMLRAHVASLTTLEQGPRCVAILEFATKDKMFVEDYCTLMLDSTYSIEQLYNALNLDPSIPSETKEVLMAMQLCAFKTAESKIARLTQYNFPKNAVKKQFYLENFEGLEMKKLTIEKLQLVRRMIDEGYY